MALVGAVAAGRTVHEHSPGTRAAALAALLLIAVWAAVVGVVGAVEENWLWPVLMGVPAAYLLWVALRMVRATPGR